MYIAMTVWICGCLLEEERKSLAQCDEGDTAADGEHDGLLDILVAVLHLEIDVEGTHEDNHCGDRFMRLETGVW